MKRKYYVVAEVQTPSRPKFSYILDLDDFDSLSSIILEETIEMFKKQIPHLKDENIIITFFHKLDN